MHSACSKKETALDLSEVRFCFHFFAAILSFIQPICII